jgi:hypothetical protein
MSTQPAPPATTDDWNFRLVKAGFRSYFWHPNTKAGRVDPPAAPEGIRAVNLNGKKRVLYVLDTEDNARSANALLGLAKDDKGLGEILGYIYPGFDWSVFPAVWLWFEVTSPENRRTLLWGEAVPANPGTWSIDAFTRLAILDKTVQRISPGFRAAMHVHLGPD